VPPLNHPGEDIGLGGCKAVALGGFFRAIRLNDLAIRAVFDDFPLKHQAFGAKLRAIRLSSCKLCISHTSIGQYSARGDALWRRRRRQKNQSHRNPRLSQWQKSSGGEETGRKKAAAKKLSAKKHLQKTGD